MEMVPLSSYHSSLSPAHYLQVHLQVDKSNVEICGKQNSKLTSHNVRTGYMSLC